MSLPRTPKSVLKKTLAGFMIASILGLGVGCSFAAVEQKTGGGHRVLIPWSRDGQYKFEAVSLDSLINVSNLQGTSALFLLSPSLVDARLAGFQPRVRTFQDRDGISVPTDQLSLHLLTLYAHIEKLQSLDADAGLGDLLPKPRVVGVEVRIPQKQKGRNVENNALYSPQLDALLFVPYHDGDNLPLTVNAGVVGHEHFHALFNYLVLKPAHAKINTIKASQVHAAEEHELREIFQDLPPEPAVVGEDQKLPVTAPQDTVNLQDWEVYHVNLLRAMNEGLADIWGWIYSGDNIFVRRSIPGVQKTRDLELSGQQKLFTMERFRQLSLSASLTGDESVRAYELGTLYARSLKNVFEPALKKAERSRNDLARIIARVLPKLKERVEAMDKGSWMKPSVLLELFVNELSVAENDLCLPILAADPELTLESATEICAKRLEKKP